MPQRIRPFSGALVLCLSMVVALLASGVVVPRTAHAAQVQVMTEHGKTVFANFSSLDATGCIVTAVFVTGSESVTRTIPGGTEQFPALGVDITVFNLCTGLLILGASGESSIINLDVSPSLGTATLSASNVAVLDEQTGNQFLVNVAVSWVGTGAITREAGANVFRSPMMTVIEHFTGAQLAAQATGTITDGITEFIPQPSTDAQIQQLRGGTVTITHT